MGFNIPHTSVDRSSWKKISLATLVLYHRLNQLDLEIYWTFHLKPPEYIFFSNAHGNFSRIDHMLGHRTTLTNFKGIEMLKYFLTTTVWNEKPITRRKLGKHMESYVFIFICLKVFSDFLFVFFIDLFFKWTCWPIYSQVHQEIKWDPNKQSRKWKT